MPTGIVRWYDPSEGVGVIQQDDGGEDVFVYRSGLQDCQLEDGDCVEYEILQRPAGLIEFPEAWNTRVINVIERLNLMVTDLEHLQAVMEAAHASIPEEIHRKYDRLELS